MHYVCLHAAFVDHAIPEDDDMATPPFPVVLEKDCPLPDDEADADEPEGMPAPVSLTSLCLVTKGNIVTHVPDGTVQAGTPCIE